MSRFRNIRRILYCVLLVSIILPGVFISTARAAETVLRITLQLPLKSHLGQNLQLFEMEVEKNSGGAIDVEIYDSAQLYLDKEVPSAVGSGSIEAGVAVLTRYVGDIPAVDVFYQPFLFDTESKVRAAVVKGSVIRDSIDEAILGTGSTVLWWQAYGGAVMLSKGMPIKSPLDMRGQKVRVFGKTLGDFVTTTGGVPTMISGSEQYLAYQRGTVNVGMTGIASVKSRKLWEVMDTVTVTNHANIEAIVVVNTAYWEGLTAEHRAIIRAAAAKAEKSVRDKVSGIEAEAYAAAEANGMSVYRPTEAELEDWKFTSSPVYYAFSKRAGKLGVKLLDAALAFENTK